MSAITSKMSGVLQNGSTCWRKSMLNLAAQAKNVLTKVLFNINFALLGLISHYVENISEQKAVNYKLIWAK